MDEVDCPVCGAVNDVQAEVKKAQVRAEGIPAVIRYEGDNQTIVWKHPLTDFTTGTQLIVHESQEAVFFRNGEALDSFPAGRYTLETATLPKMNSNAYVRVVDESTGMELIRYDLEEDFSIETAIVVAEIYRHNGEWKFNAIGSGFQGGLEALCINFGVNV